MGCHETGAALEWLPTKFWRHRFHSSTWAFDREMPFAFFVSIQNGTAELERHPAHRPAESVVPEPAFEKLNWKA